MTRPADALRAVARKGLMRDAARPPRKSAVPKKSAAPVPRNAVIMTWSPQSKAPAGPVEAIADFADVSELGGSGLVELLSSRISLGREQRRVRSAASKSP